MKIKCSNVRSFAQYLACYKTPVNIPWWKWKCYFLSCVQLCDSMDCSLPAPLPTEFFSKKYQIAICFSRGSSRPKDRTQVLQIASRFFTIWVKITNQWNVLLPPPKWKQTGITNVDLAMGRAVSHLSTPALFFFFGLQKTCSRESYIMTPRTPSQRALILLARWSLDCFSWCVSTGKKIIKLMPVWSLAEAGTAMGCIIYDFFL